MALEPGPSAYRFALDRAQPGEDLVGTGADLAPATLLEAYRRGVFPMGLGRHGLGRLGWWSPDPRGIVPLPEFRVSRSLRRSCRRFDVTVDRDFAGVVQGCADRGRPGRWITDRIEAAYLRLHLLGWAHSVEVWDEGGLAGGLYGVAIGGLFAGESMFHRATDASKVALVGLVDLLDDGDPRRLLDVQWVTPHLASLGARAVPRQVYLQLLAQALPLSGPAWPPPSGPTLGLR